MPDLKDLRGQLPATHDRAYFNAGTNGPLPSVVTQTLIEAARTESTQGRIRWAQFMQRMEEATRLRLALAALLNAPAGSIALAHNTTEGMNVALWGQRWETGDEVITTSLEHPGLTLPLALLRQRLGVTVRFVEVGLGDPERVLDGIAKAFNRRTRLVALSHVSYASGAVFPLPEIIELAHRHGCPVLVDGAQSAGAIPLDMQALNVDYYAIPGQKWLCGPEGTGALYVHPDRLDDLMPTYAGYPTNQAHDDRGWFIPAAGAQRFESLTTYPPALSGFNAALAWLGEAAGFPWIYERVAYLAATLRSQLEALDGVTVLTPAGAQAGLLNFDVQGWSPAQQAGLAEALANDGFVLRTIPHHPYCLRVSTGFYNTDEEIKGLAGCLQDWLARGPQAVTVPEYAALLPREYMGP